jgi:hypothetical protein
MGTILLIILILLLLGAFPRWGYNQNWGYGPSGILGLVLIIVLILVLPWATSPTASDARWVGHGLGRPSSLKTGRRYTARAGISPDPITADLKRRLTCNLGVKHEC